MTDSFSSHTDNVHAPSRAPFAVTPSDSAQLSPLPKALLIGSAGTIVVRGVDSSADITLPVSAGQILPIRTLYVRATGTTATSIVALS